MPLTGPIRREQLLIAAALGFLGVLALTFWVDDPREAISVLYTVPIALCALALGIRAGVIAALIATALLALWIGTSDVEIGMSGWIAREVAFFGIALLVGRYEQLARALVRQQAEERAAAEVQEGVVQSLVIATYELRRGNEPDAQAAIDDALTSAKEIISSRLPEVRPGDLRKPPQEEERTPGP